jgi:hypothetical protein
VTLRTKRRKDTTETIDTGIETQVKDRITVNREIAVSTAKKVITSNETMETPSTIINAEATVVTIITQEADPVTITAKGKEPRQNQRQQQTKSTLTRQPKPRQQQLPT